METVALERVGLWTGQAFSSEMLKFQQRNKGRVGVPGGRVKYWSHGLP